MDDDNSEIKPMTERQKRRHESRMIVATWAEAHGIPITEEIISPKTQATIFAAILEEMGVRVFAIEQESQKSCFVEHERVDENGVNTGRKVKTKWARSRQPNGRASDLKDLIEMANRIGQAGTREELPDFQCNAYAAAILRKHLADPRQQIENAIRKCYGQNIGEPFKKSYHMLEAGDNVHLGIKLVKGQLLVEYAFQPERSAWLKGSYVNIRTNITGAAQQGLAGQKLSLVVDTGECEHLKVLGQALIKNAFSDGYVLSLELEQKPESLCQLLQQKAA